MTIIMINKRYVKQFPYREQAIVWCYEHHLVLTGGRLGSFNEIWDAICARKSGENRHWLCI